MLNKIEEHKGLLKESYNGAILMDNKTKANEYLAKRKALAETAILAKEINTLKERLDGLEEIKNDMADIKNLLQQLASGNNK